MLSKICHYVPKTELKSIYHAIFASHLRYGCQIWGLENTKKVEKIKKIQDKALRIINFAEFRAPVDPLNFSNELLKLSDMVRLSNCLLVHDFIQKVLPDCFADYFEKFEIKYTDFKTKNSELGNLFVPSVNKTGAGLHSVGFGSIECWSGVSRECSVDFSAIFKRLPQAQFFDS